MRGHDRLSLCFYGVELYTGKITPVPHRNVIGFFIVEHPADKDWLEKQVRQFLVAGFYDITLFGSHATEWRQGFINQWKKMHAGNMLPEQLPVKVSDDLGDFTVKLTEAVSLRSIVPLDRYLFYDDSVLYKQVLKSIPQNYLSEEYRQ